MARRTPQAALDRKCKCQEGLKQAGPWAGRKLATAGPRRLGGMDGGRKAQPGAQTFHREHFPLVPGQRQCHIPSVSMVVVVVAAIAGPAVLQLFPDFHTHSSLFQVALWSVPSPSQAMVPGGHLG
ncbi:hypothetical protein CNYM01_07784 [Colletotrichum nymphaeae SA-01]|uniref:Uncharacterized protein n=1 Tax=Colletotrichum nymphaeae SA-01 TaxID=1460502 RepID=A0A135SWQ7_9PEZI|nr:hypothetical protein CNYM01_07784 [Colletotrichum nymphaeae SA-01]